MINGKIELKVLDQEQSQVVVIHHHLHMEKVMVQLLQIIIVE